MVTNMTEVQKKDKRIIAVTFLLTFGILASIYAVLVNQSISNEKIRCSYIAANAADHFRMTVDCIMVRTNTLETLVQDHAGSVIVNEELPLDGSRADEKITAYAFISDDQLGDILVCLIDGEWYQFVATDRAGQP